MNEYWWDGGWGRALQITSWVAFHSPLPWCEWEAGIASCSEWSLKFSLSAELVSVIFTVRKISGNIISQTVITSTFCIRNKNGYNVLIWLQTCTVVLPHPAIKSNSKLEVWEEFWFPPPNSPLKSGGGAGPKMGRGSFSSSRNTSQGYWSHRMWTWILTRVICPHLAAIKCKLALSFRSGCCLLCPLLLLVKGRISCHCWNQFCFSAPTLCYNFWVCDKYPFVLLIKFHICSIPVHLILWTDSLAGAH